MCFQWGASEGTELPVVVRMVKFLIFVLYEGGKNLCNPLEAFDTMCGKRKLRPVFFGLVCVAQ